ncbi:hypothetical protein RCL_jg26276.t2 [Rhizophagus clarus]|uniref:Uncharacterized protein n=1 Tax=Rhizophagus clarus TaxID=94130 RepID=A0A8H3QE50_9GLOM|nr:hypothetical protein RCL_jg26276.t2 [Rhizophagus clarus]
MVTLFSTFACLSFPSFEYNGLNSNFKVIHPSNHTKLIIMIKYAKMLFSPKTEKLAYIDHGDRELQEVSRSQNEVQFPIVDMNKRGVDDRYNSSRIQKASD